MFLYQIAMQQSKRFLVFLPGAKQKNTTSCKTVSHVFVPNCHATVKTFFSFFTWSKTKKHREL